MLSQDARDAFFKARATLDGGSDLLGEDAWHDKVTNAFSSLRTSLCEDLNSRRGPTLISLDENVAQ